MTWDTTYEGKPQDGYNPGFGARTIRNLKTGIRERLEVEHGYGPNNETDVGAGVHKEGAARIEVTDAGSASRTNRITAGTTIGRVTVDLSDEATPRKINEVDGTTDISTKKYQLKVVSDIGSGAETVTLFDIDDIVDIYHDELIGGIKEFTLRVKAPAIDIELIEGSPTSEEQKYVATLKELNDLYADLRANYPKLGEEGDWSLDTTGTITASKIYGAVWG